MVADEVQQMGDRAIAVARGNQRVGQTERRLMMTIAAIGACG